MAENIIFIFSLFDIKILLLDEDLVQFLARVIEFANYNLRICKLTNNALISNV